ncbi:MAG: phosphate ABC transporter permease subunit PstC [Firmicutes bacterium]|nr:phosphate ABC transporter permease subunit PstC [Bacillota bacterium]
MNYQKLLVIDLKDKVFEWATRIASLAMILLIFIMIFSIGYNAAPSIREFGWSFLTSRVWNPVQGVFGALPYIFGTLVSTALALLLAGPLSLAAAIFLAEFAPIRIKNLLGFLIDVLAAIPSIIYGLWGNFVLVPVLMKSFEPWLGKNLGFLPFFQGPPYGVGMLAAGIVLAIMISPVITVLCREVIGIVPGSQREAMLAMGATRWEVVKYTVLPYARQGIIGGFALGLGKAIGETLAVTMVIGNRPEISWSLFSPSHTMTSVIINEFAEAINPLHTAALIHIALLLFLITLIINIIARVMIYRFRWRKEWSF